MAGSQSARIPPHPRRVWQDDDGGVNRRQCIHDPHGMSELVSEWCLSDSTNLLKAP